MNVLKSGKTRLLKLLALLLILAAFGLAALAQDVSQIHNDDQICVSWDDHGNCTNWDPNPKLSDSG